MDISEFPGYDADKVASGTAQSILLYFTTRMEMDVAYVAMFNEIDDIKALLGENETYFYRVNSFANAGERSMAVPLEASMFTGDNAGNVALALENGVLYGMVPGYNSDYVDGKTVTDTAVIVPFLLIPADILVAAS